MRERYLPRITLARRHLLMGAISAAGLAAAGPGYAARLIATPRQTAGPFYPTEIPLDSDNDLVSVEGRPERAAGEVTHVFGRVLDQSGRPVPGVRVEIWQCDAFGVYHHPRDRGSADPNFQGFGRMTVGEDGAYRFRTIKPVPYTWRTPHIHFALFGRGIEGFTTQLYIAGHPQNEGDFIFSRIGDKEAQETVTARFEAAPELEPGALKAAFDIVLGRTVMSG